MSTELSTEISPEIINSLILTGDMSKLTATQQTQYYTAVCKSVDINPITQPFAIIILQGKKTLYATKGCTQQLSNNRKINTEITKRETIETVYVASCRATMPDGRFTDDDGIVSIVGLKGVELANAMMKAVTKAKRRAVLALCGLGMPDESEVEDMAQRTEIKEDPTKSRLDNIIDTTAEEVKDVKPEEKSTKTKNTKKETESKPTADSDKKTDSVNSDTTKTVSGLIEEMPKIATVANANKNGVPELKHSFKIGDKFYGTFDLAIAKKIMECVDNRRLVKLGYTERFNSDKTKVFNDIVSFRIINHDDLPI